MDRNSGPGQARAEQGFDEPSIGMVSEAFGDGSVNLLNVVIELKQFAGGATRIGDS
jgi:hypothetical protein